MSTDTTAEYPSISAEVDYLDGEFTVQESEPSTIDGLKALIGEQGVIDETVSNLRYRNKYPRVYKLVSAALTKDHGFARAVKETKTLKDKTVKNILISEMDHARAFLAADDATNRPILQELFAYHGALEPLYVKGERAGGGGKISQAALDASNAFFAAGDDKVEDVVGKIEAFVPSYKVGRDGDNNITPESLARGIQTLNKYRMKQASADAMSALK